MKQSLSICFLMVLVLTSCQTAPNWVSGNFAGILNCEDCSESATVVYQITETGALAQFTENDTTNGQLESIAQDRFKVALGTTPQYFVFQDSALHQTDNQGNILADELGNNLIYNRLDDNFPLELLFADWALLAIDDTIHPEGAIPMLRFSAHQNQILGFTGCNRMFGSFQMEADGQITILDLGTTKMFCENFAAEALFLKRLEGTHPIKLEANKLVLGPMIFKKQ